MNTIQDNEKSCERKNDELETPKEDNVVPRVTYLSMSIFCIIIALCGLPVGWDIGTIGFIISTSTFKETYGNSLDGETNISSLMVGIIISSFNLGCLIGCLGLSKLTSRIGFKGTIFTGNFIYLVGTVIQILSGWFRLNIWLMILGRVNCGICCGALCVLAPRYLNQLIIVPKKDMYLSFFQTSICLAILGGNLTNFVMKHDYLKILSCQLTIILMTSCLTVFLPESHHYYISKNEIDKAFMVVKKLHVRISDDQIIKLIDQVPTITTLPKGWIRDKQYYKPLIQCCVMMIFQQLTGINYFFYYGSLVFSSLGINTTTVSIIMSVVNLVGSLMSNIIIGKFGRIQLLLMIGSAIMSSLLTIYMILAYISTPSSLTGMVIITCLFIASFATTWGPIPGIMVTRISCNSNDIIGLANCVNYTANCLITVVTPVMISTVGFNFSLLFIVSLISLVIYIYYMSSL
ncbi:uncharacterized protein AC631_04094 [Debaryomyces fabryi]|uniref:Major facilitator superfamily (MFS) profile domain-containing protein n=1 Tax=Debaryomyces fabryi TaxID=58627 RepID=A0A0V1PV46_9ASCO|nr:uncharacterized protein AC631_04094 [Debaryomyces fabryi]KSA00135.1 hypothetical protein AC631_04094 [Debaryomyces fabryi]CUM47802.1 unnamed protein product [Debaryomyces fabryi]